MKRPTMLTRAAAIGTTMGVVLAGALVFTAAPAQAMLTETDYGFQTFAFGTKAASSDISARSGRTALSHIACTRLAGRHNSDSIADVLLPNPDPSITVHGVLSSSNTFRTKSGNKGTRSINRIEKVVLGPTDGQHIVIAGLRTRAKAWADKNGAFHLFTKVTSVDIRGETGTQLDDVLNQAGAGVGDLFTEIRKGAAGLAIPGLGTLYVGRTHKQKKAAFARAFATALRVRLDTPAGSTVIIGRSFARINRGLPAGVMSGAGYGADGPAVLGGVVRVGRLAVQLLPCQGTHGKVLKTDISGANLGGTGQLVVGSLGGRAYGVQHTDGSVLARTKGLVDSAVLGPMTIRSIKGQVTVRQTRSGKIRKTIGGSTIGSLMLNGVAHAIPRPSQDLLVGPAGGPYIAKVEFFTRHRTTRSLFVTAVKITLFGGTSGNTVIRLGNARAAIHRH